MATTKFQDLRKTVEAIALEKTLDPDRLGVLLTGEFQPTRKMTAYHQTYEGKMAPGSLFTGCELRYPKSPKAKSAVLVCQLSPQVQVHQSEVEAAYKGHVDFTPSPASGLAGDPAYLSVSDDTTKISFGFPGNTERASVVVVDMKIQ